MAKSPHRLNLAPGLKLDADYLAGRSLALLGKRGAGKTFACRVLTEEFHAAQVQTVIIDPMGVFWGLRAGADDRQRGLPIPVFGGEHCDAPLEPTAGALMADLAVDEGLSMILDMSGFSSRTQERTFAAAFFDRLYRRNKHLLHLIVDEADLFGPQKPRGDDVALLVAMENIVRRGRNQGLGITMASQRAAVLNKDLLSQVDVLAALRVTAPTDRAAVQEWVRGQGGDEQWSQVAKSLPTLATGEAWFWAPERDILTRSQIRQAHTFDCSPTRERGSSAARAPKNLADVDLARISERIAATVQRAKASDPRELRGRIHELEREVAAARVAAGSVEAERIEVQVPVVPDGLVEGLCELRRRLDLVRDRVDALAESIGFVEEIASEVGSIIAAPEPQPTPASGLDVGTSVGPPPAPPFSARPAVSTDVEICSAEDSSGVGLVRARRNVLNALATLAEYGISAPSRDQLALWACVSPKSSGFKNNLGALRSSGLIDYPARGAVALTDGGWEQVDREVLAEVSDAVLHEQVRRLIVPARWQLVKQLIEAHPGALSREELARRAGVSVDSSGFKNNLGALRTLGLLDYPARGYVVAASILFLGLDRRAVS
ncbi:helicase HerA domain-containing protein [Mycobacteroides abscessus]